MNPLERELAALGLVSFGRFPLTAEDGDLPPLAGGAAARSGDLIGNAGSAMWSVFRGSPEAGDGEPAPLDRWSEREIGALAETLGRRALYPFGGPPWWPFVTWASRLGVFSQSPLGVLVHRRYGPWIAFRAVLLSAEPVAPAEISGDGGPCPGCRDKPCLTACPVGAINLDAPYDYAACRGHVQSTWPEQQTSDRPGCDTGCLARQACPYGRSYAYAPDHGRFHMAAFAAVV